MIVIGGRENGGEILSTASTSSSVLDGESRSASRFGGFSPRCGGGCVVGSLFLSVFRFCDSYELSLQTVFGERRADRSIVAGCAVELFVWRRLGETSAGRADDGLRGFCFSWVVGGVLSRRLDLATWGFPLFLFLRRVGELLRGSSSRPPLLCLCELCAVVFAGRSRTAERDVEARRHAVRSSLLVGAGVSLARLLFGGVLEVGGLQLSVGAFVGGRIHPSSAEPLGDESTAVVFAFVSVFRGAWRVFPVSFSVRGISSSKRPCNLVSAAFASAARHGVDRFPHCGGGIGGRSV